MSKQQINNLLTGAQSYSLHKYLDERREHAASETAADLAREAEKALAFPVTAANVGSARRDLGIDLKLRGHGSGGGHAFVSRTRIIAHALVWLYSVTGATPPAELVDIANK